MKSLILYIFLIAICLKQGNSLMCSCSAGQDCNRDTNTTPCNVTSNSSCLTFSRYTVDGDPLGVWKGCQANCTTKSFMEPSLQPVNRVYVCCREDLCNDGKVTSTKATETDSTKRDEDKKNSSTNASKLHGMRFTSIALTICIFIY